MVQNKGLGQLLSDSWNNFTKNIDVISLVTILLFIPSIITLLLPYTFIDGYSVNEPITSDLFEKSTGIIILYIILVLISFACSILTYISYVYISLQTARNKKVDYKQAIRYSMSKFWIMLGTSLLVMLMVLGLLLLLIIPGIIFCVYWTFIWQAMIFKNLKWKSAADYSKSIVKNRWWRTLGYIFLISLLLLAILIVPFVILSLIGIAGEILANLIMMFAYAFFTFFETHYFLELDRTKTAVVAKPSKKK